MQELIQNNPESCSKAGYFLRRKINKILSKRTHDLEAEWTGYDITTAYKLRELIRDAFNLTNSSLLPDDSIQAFWRTSELNDMAVSEFIMSVENAFGITLSEEQWQKIDTVGGLVTSVSDEIRNRKQP